MGETRVFLDSGRDDTIVASDSSPRASDPGAGAVDQTLASGAEEARAGEPGAGHGVVVRAGLTAEHFALVPVHPQRYAIERELARGGMGRILTARDRRLGRPVAIKELLPGSGELRARFEREARITAKLQHPGIVSLLEAGTWPDGDPFYVMKLVAGESLDKVIAHRATLDERLSLLPNVIAAADALAYAHSERVIHRDLKPANVLVGAFGETVVIDWGLAKDLGDASGEPDVSIGPYRSAPGDQTQAGEVMGTPAYMPPEQALGEPVDERADVYALGAMLYHVLAGAPPYTANSAEAILAAVVVEPPVPLAARSPGVPPDLATIVSKAMAHAAADRYPSARELADELKKFQTGQLVGAHHYSTWQLVRRWVRRQRTPVAVAMVAIMLLGTLGVVSVRRIIREQARTEQSRRDAEDLMSFMLLDLRGKLEPLGRLDLLDDVAKKAVAYYDQRGATDSARDLRTRGLARRHLGEVLAAQGHVGKALAEYRAALAIAQTLAGKEPGNATWQLDLANDHDNVGDALAAQGDTAGALAAYGAAMEIRERLVRTDPSNAERQRALSRSHSALGHVRRAQGDGAGALAEFRAALAILEMLAARDPTNANLQRALSIEQGNVGHILLKQGKAADALASYQAGLAIAKTLAANEPTNAERQQDLAASHAHVGSVLLAQGDTTGALAAHQAAMAIDEALAANDPTNEERQLDLSNSRNKLGDVLLARGDAAGALAAYRAALVIRESVAAKDPSNAERQRDLSIGYNNVGDVLDIQGDAAGALAAHRAALATCKLLVAKDPTNAGWQRDLAVTHVKVGDMLRRHEDELGALDEYRAAMKIVETLAANDRENPIWQQDLSVCHTRIGNVLRARGDATGALAAYRAAMAIDEVRAAKDPTNAIAQRGLSISHEKIGNMLLGQQDPAGALAAYRAAMAITQVVAAKDPTNALGQEDLALGHEKIGDALVAMRDQVRALAEYKVGLEIAQRLHEADDTNADLRDLATRLTKKVATCCGRPRASPPP